ncbi:membrane protein [Gordoniibacillus kamchatkensis]|uniref:Membrane protein n=1 Tax=Gordoniibacillus kamchatkensis TaxID=1590651 RepID=A0ABR5AFZ5_9BACL|nr:TerC family protein [Paenibacillus sp. VKM B-2647]KIL39975.1 membrane protein [Paenibacillus sp. VKM B-2647]
MESELLVGLVKLIAINIVLSGDNAVVIAMACRRLPADRQKTAMLWGGFGAVGLRVVLTIAAVWILSIPFVQLAGGILLIWIAAKLMKGDDGHGRIASGTTARQAVRTIITADVIMSLDNVVAVAGAAGGSMLLIGLGLVISIPLILWGSQLLMKLMNRFPVIVYLGAGLLGYTAGEMALGDRAAGHWIEGLIPMGHYALPAGAAAAVMLYGKAADKIRASRSGPVSKEMQ